MAMLIQVKGASELRAAAAALRRGKGTLRQELAQSMRTAGQSTLRDVKTAAETMTMVGYRTGKRRFPAGVGGPGGIRRRVSRVTELEVKTGGASPTVRFVVRSDRLGNARNMPRLLDSGRKFRHPVMGNVHVWAGQKGQPWFRKTVIRDMTKFRAEAQRAIDRTVAKIERQI